MVQKRARRWLSRNKWNIAKLYTGIYEVGGAFYREYLACKFCLNSNAPMLNLANQLQIDIETRNI